jgi:hypothetical protein
MTRLLRIRAATALGLALGTASLGVLAAPAALAAELPTPTVTVVQFPTYQAVTITGTGCFAGNPDMPLNVYQSTPGMGDATSVSPDGSWRFDEQVDTSLSGTFSITVFCDNYASEQPYPTIPVTLGNVAAPVAAAPSEVPVAAAPSAAPATSKLIPGKPFEQTFTGFRPYERVHVVLHSTPRDMGWFTADANGTVIVRFTTPADLELTGHSLALAGDQGTTQTVALTATAPAPELAYTGASVTVPLVLGSVLVLAGAGTLVAARRRPGKVSQA